MGCQRTNRNTHAWKHPSEQVHEHTQIIQLPHLPAFNDRYNTKALRESHQIHTKWQKDTILLKESFRFKLGSMDSMWHAVNYYWLAPQFVKSNKNHHTYCISLHLTFTVLDDVKHCIASTCDKSLVFLICKLLRIKASAKWINVNDYYLFDSNCYHFTLRFVRLKVSCSCVSYIIFKIKMLLYI